MASELVERLAKKWDDAFAGQEYPEDDPERHEMACADTQWWMNAIADELDAAMPDNDNDSDYYGFGTAAWLRTQAETPDDE